MVLSDKGAKEVKQTANAAELLKHFRKNDWNQYRIVCRGPEITLFVNGVLMCRFTDHISAPSAGSGIIALQMHPGPPMKIQYRNLRIKQLK